MVLAKNNVYASSCKIVVQNNGENARRLVEMDVICALDNVLSRTASIE